MVRVSDITIGGTSPGRAPSSCRRGFTLVELLIALVLLDVGLLALVGLAGAVARNADRARGATTSLAIATGRIERMASIPCAGTISGTATASAGVTEWFTDVPGPNLTRALRDSVAVSIPGRSRALVLGTRARC